MEILENPVTIGENAFTNLEDLLAYDIDTGLKDYGHFAPPVRYGMGFVRQLAADAAVSKSALRGMMRKSPAWNEALQAWVINGNRTHDPNPNVIYKLAYQIFRNSAPDKFVWSDTALYFANEDPTGADWVRKIAPNAIREGRKKSKIFRDFCVAAGIWDDTQGSEFQKLYAKLADEMSSKKIPFKLYVSINPAHFLTMSNPKQDKRGATMVSCHSLNSNEYSYNSGCTGYARDEVTMIAFTASDPAVPETLNNRKTSRQIYAYRPGSGILLQSRLYSTNSGGSYGGMDGDQPETKLYRDLIEREISFCEDVPNLWSVQSSNEYYNWVERDDNFGGYPDWEYSRMGAHVALRHGHEDERLLVGAGSICLICGDDCCDSLYCNDCDSRCRCDECEELFDEDDLCTVYRNGDEYHVCSGCRDRYYTYCDCCGRYVRDREVHSINDGDCVCNECLEEYYTQCDDCGEWFRTDDGTEVAGYRIVCPDCISGHYMVCEDCDEYHHVDDMRQARRSGVTIWVCDECADDHYTECDVCRHLVHNDDIEESVNEETGEVTTICSDCTRTNREVA